MDPSLTRLLFPQPCFSAYRASVKRKSARRFKYEWTSGLSSSPASRRPTALRSALRMIVRAKSSAALTAFVPGWTKWRGKGTSLCSSSIHFSKRPRRSSPISWPIGRSQASCAPRTIKSSWTVRIIALMASFCVKTLASPRAELASSNVP